MAQGWEFRRGHLRLVAPLQEQEVLLQEEVAHQLVSEVLPLPQVVLQQVQEAQQQGLEALLRELEEQVQAQVQQLVLAQAEVTLLEQAVDSVLELVEQQEELQPQVQEEE